ncbi:MAG TPA: 2-dehydropantoate 2-reductase [Chloroflexota bacterium]|jgi:2-dehydropantoate 2-reductase|nr:2-dehydropantoate 2-reductase [Chloroflexota bacterium]
MRILIMGAGAIGGNVGAPLARAGYDVTLIDQWPAHVEAMKATGLRVSGTAGDYVVPVEALHMHEAQAVEEPFDAVFLAVKGYDTEWATMFAIRFLKPNGVVIVFQNGINDERVAAVAGRERTLGCVITIGAGLYEPGHVVRTDTGGGFKIGELDGRDTARAGRFVETLSHAAPTTLTTNLLGERWSKLAVNCMANPLAGLSGYGTAEVRTEPLPRRIAIQVGAEVIRVGRAAGHEVEPIMGIAAQRIVDAAEGRGLEAVEAEMAADGRRSRGGQPSLLQDVMRGRRTEVDELNGLVVAEGKRLGVPTPFNEAIVREVHRHGVGRLVPDPKHLEPLARMLPSLAGASG